MLSHILLRIKPSAIIQLNNQIVEMKRQGQKIIDLSIGEPDFDTPLHIKEAAIKALHHGETKYPLVAGSLSLREAILRKYQDQYALNFKLNEVMVANGAKQVLFNAFLATLGQDQEVITAAPFWTSYQDMIICAGGRLVAIPCNEAQGFKLLPAQLERVMSTQTKWVLLNSPANPTGAIYSPEELSALGEVIRAYPHVMVMCDDIYDSLRYDSKKPYSFLNICPDLKERTLIVNGLSKTYAMTGWRVGYGLGPQTLIQAMVTIQSQSTSGVCTLAQAGAAAALNQSDDFLKDWLKQYRERRQIVYDKIQNCPLLSCQMPEGAFYFYVNCKNLIGKMRPDGKTIASDHDVADYIFAQVKVAVVPGQVFGLSPYFRLSYAVPIDVLKEGMDSILKAIALLR